MIGGLVLPVHQLYMDKYLTLFGEKIIMKNSEYLMCYFEAYWRGEEIHV